MAHTIAKVEATLSCGRRSIAGLRWITALGVTAALGMPLLGGYELYDARQAIWRQAEDSDRNLSIALERDIARNLNVYDLSVRGVIKALEEPGFDQVSPGIRRQALFDAAVAAEDLGAVIVLDAQGDIIEDSTSIIPHHVNLGDRDFFRIHQDQSNAGLFISRPYHSRLNDGDLRISISRRLPTADGHFAGVAEGALRLTFFRRLFEKLDLGSKGTVTLLRTDGRIIMRYPFQESDVDRDISQSESYPFLSSSSSGQFIAKTTLNDRESLYTFRSIDKLPLILALTTDVDDIFAPWRQKIIVLGPVLLILSSLTLLSMLLFRRETSRRIEAEQSLRSAAEELSFMAKTDALTDLANRRSFESEIEKEWKRAIRSQSAISLLILDVDSFKLYNDRYGHPDGDRVLQAVAKCMNECIRRPDDLAVRYGGEEFVVLLPETGRVGARIVADKIRALIERLAIPHDGCEIGRVTVSIGTATCKPRHNDESAAFIQTADAALYVAKRSGRNRVTEADPTIAVVPAGSPVAQKHLQVVRDNLDVTNSFAVP